MGNPTDYRFLPPPSTPFPIGEPGLVPPPEVQSVEQIAEAQRQRPISPEKLADILSDKTALDSGVILQLQPRPIPGIVFLNKKGKPFSIPQEGEFTLTSERNSPDKPVVE